MSEKVYDVPPEWKKRAYVDADKYQEMYARSLKDPNGFWAEQAKRLHWYKAPSKIKNSSFGPGNVSIKWFEDGVLNVAYNCIDRHLAKRANQTAIIWEGDDLDVGALGLADQRARQRRGDRDAALLGVGLGLAHDLPDLLFLGVFVHQRDGGAELDGIARELGDIDDVGARELVLELRDAALVDRLGFLGGVILGVLREVAM